MHGMFRDTWLEMIDRKAYIFFGAITLIGLIVLLASRGININIHVEGDMPPDIMETIKATLLLTVNWFIWFMHIIAVFSCMGLIPRMMERGRAEYYLSKPVARGTLITNKLVSVWLLYSMMITIGTVVLAIAFGITYGSFEPNIFYSLLVHLFLFAVWLAIVGLFNVWTGSQTTTLIMAVVVWILQFVLMGHEQIGAFFNSAVTKWLVDALYYILPKPSLIGEVGSSLLKGNPVTSWEPVWTTLLFAIAAYVAMLGIFRRKSF